MKTTYIIKEAHAKDADTIHEFGTIGEADIFKKNYSGRYSLSEVTEKTSKIIFGVECSLEEFISNLFPVPENWKEYKKGERVYSGLISEMFFSNEEEAEDYYNNYEE